jgi:hypothetical protein
MINPMVFKMAQNEPRYYAGEKFHLLVALCDTCRDTYASPGKIESLFFLKACERYRERRVISH